MNSTVLVVGSINADLSLSVSRHPLPGETLTGSSTGMLPGGKGANQAVAAARLGAEVEFVGAVGNDPAAKPALSLLRSSGVELEEVRVVDGPTGLAVVTVDERGENTIIFVPGANATVDAKRIAGVSQVAMAPLVVSQGELPVAAVDAIAEQVTGRFVLNLAPVIPVRPETLRRADPLVVNEHEAKLACEYLVPKAAPPTGDRAAAEALLRAGIATVVLTRGARGALVGDSSGIVEVPSPSVEAIDTTGAGDAFVGALVARMAKGDDLQAATRIATRVGAFACTRRGAQLSYPDLSDELPV